MAFKMNRGSAFGKELSALQKRKRKKGRIKGSYGLISDGRLDWEHIGSKIKDFFGMGNVYWNPDWQSVKRAFGGKTRRNVKKSKGGRKLKPTTIAQRDVYEDFLLGNRSTPSAKAGDSIISKSKKA